MPSNAGRRTTAKCMIVNLATDEFKLCQFNPPRFTRQHAVKYDRITVVGLGHQVLQYSNTANRQAAKLAFTMDRRVSPFDIEDFANFIEALTLPSRGVEEVGNAAPPVTLFVWPGVFSFEAVVTSFNRDDELLALNGTPLRTTVTVTLEEKRDLAMFSEDIRNEIPLTAEFIEETLTAELEFEFE